MADQFEVRAKVRHVQISPQKVRLVVDAVRGKDVEEALNILRYMPHKAASSVYKLVQSAAANAEQNYGLETDELYISSIFADEGPRRRKAPYGGRFAGRGRFRPIIRRTSHITVNLAERDADGYGDF